MKHSHSVYFLHGFPFYPCLRCKTKCVLAVLLRVILDKEDAYLFTKKEAFFKRAGLCVLLWLVICFLNIINLSTSKALVGFGHRGCKLFGESIRSQQLTGHSAPCRKCLVRDAVGSLVLLSHCI